MQSYAGAFAQIADEEMDTWKTGEPMRTIEPMQRITLRAILQTIFGAHDESLEKLEDLVPKTVDVGDQGRAPALRAEGPRPAQPVGQIPAPARRRSTQFCTA